MADHRLAIIIHDGGDFRYPLEVKIRESAWKFLPGQNSGYNAHMLHGCKQIRGRFIHLLAGSVHLARPLVDSHGYYLPVSPIRVGEHGTMKGLRDVFSDVGADNWRAGDQQSLALPGSTGGWLLRDAALLRRFVLDALSW